MSMNLVGSPKQISWAKSIIDDFLREGLIYQERMGAVVEVNDATREKKQFALLCVAETLRLAETEKDASWWINGGAGRSFVLEFRAIADSKTKGEK